MIPSLIATDLDGTFLSTDKQVSSTNADAMLRAASLGVPIVVATGRPARWLQVLDAIRDAHPYVISSNGAVIYDLAERRITETFPVPAAVALEVAAEMRAVVPQVAFAVEYGLGYGREPGYPLRGDFVEADVIGPLEQLVDGREFVKLLAISDELDSDTLAAALVPVCGERVVATWSMGGPLGLVEVSAAGVTKGAALARLADELDADLADAVAFGDMPNDLSMLELVGHPFAMADAHPLLRDAGFPRAGSHDDSGVGHAVNQLLDSREWFSPWG